MPLYFQHPDGRLSKVYSDHPENPENLPIVDHPDEVVAHPPLEVLKRQIEAERDGSLASGYLHSDGHVYPSDERFQAQVSAFVLAWNIGILDGAQSVLIRRQDNVTVSMTRAEVMALAGGLMAHVQAIWANSWAEKDAL